MNVGQSMSFNGPIIHIRAFRLSVWKLFVPILGSIALQLSQNILFSLPSNLSYLYFPSMPPGNLHVFLVEAGVSDAVLLSLSSDYNAFLQRKSTWALYLFPFQHTLAHVLIHQRKIDKDLQNEIITKAAILYPTVHFVSWVEPRLLFSIFVCSFFKTFVFLWQFYVCFKALLALFGMIQKKLHVFLREW